MRTLVYFVADVHLGMQAYDPAERERRFVSFLKDIPRDALAVYLLGDIWDFWYEYRDVVPREGARVVAELIALVDAGVDVVFVPGNHDIWAYSFFESLGIRKCEQPLNVRIGDKSFCLGHGDSLGGGRVGYNLILKLFRSRFAQKAFSTLHPWIAWRLATSWSESSRKKHEGYHFRGTEEPLYRFAAKQQADYCIFGHFHDRVDMPLPNGGRLIVLGDWMDGKQPHAVFDTASSSFSLSLSSPRS
ncbi:MAG: UDP-2,3-diacylglucosamine diphosphatase [Bacteroidales bacterium]|nr:UDP-2,3-diacylglucosamine diphosphatase [Bacteroidales bacterium]